MAIKFLSAAGFNSIILFTKRVLPYCCMLIVFSIDVSFGTQDCFRMLCLTFSLCCSPQALSSPITFFKVWAYSVAS